MSDLSTYMITQAKSFLFKQNSLLTSLNIWEHFFRRHRFTNKSVNRDQLRALFSTGI